MQNALPTLEDLKRYAVSQKDNVEVVRQTLYDSATYAAAGQTSLSFFQNPIGQNGKTKADTNMENAGQLPTGKNFLVTSIEVLFFPGVNPTTVQEGAALSATNFSNDVYTVAKSGYLDFFVLSKSYLSEAPIGRFPPKTRLDISSAAGVGSQAASTGTDDIALDHDYAVSAGRPYFVDPNITLVSNQNFNVTLNWPAAVALPSGQDGSIFVVLDGLQYRWSQ